MDSQVTETNEVLSYKLFMDIYNNKVKTGEGMVLKLPTGIELINHNKILKDDL